MKKELWIDIRELQESRAIENVSFALNLGYTGVLLDVKQLSFANKFPQNIKIFVRINSENKTVVKKYMEEHTSSKIIVLFDYNEEKLLSFFESSQQGIFITISDKATMEKAIELSKIFKIIIIQFDSVTNIPLELVLAYSQQYGNTICKIIQTSEDGWVAAMTMEMGSHSIMIKGGNINELELLRDKMESLNTYKINIEELKVNNIKHIGMGDRVCIDTISKLDEDEGMIIGSTSTGGILVSSENHFLPYMDLRPFRVNAGAIHSYVLCPDNKTKYLSELRAGDEVLVVNSEGGVRAVSVGRIKMEKRPMLLINAESANGKVINVIVQDDWHIRILSSKGSVKNSVLLTKGETVLGYIMKEGRHLGVAIDETINEK